MEIDPAKLDWSGSLKIDWEKLAGNASDVLGVSKTDLLGAIPLRGAPINELTGVSISGSQAALFGKTIADVANALSDGELSNSEVQAIGSSVAAAAGSMVAGAMLAGSAIGSAIPGLGTIIGAAIGAVVGGVISLFSTAKEDEKRAIRNAKVETKDAVTAWEQTVFVQSWRQLASASAPPRSISPDNAIDAALGRYGQPSWGAADMELLQPYMTRAGEILVGLGMRPEGRSTGYGSFSGSPVSWAAAEAAWEKPFETKKDGFGAVLYRRSWKAQDVEWSHEAPTEQERFQAWKSVVDERVKFEGEISNVFTAYTLQLVALKQGFVTQAQKLISDGKIKSVSRNVLGLKLRLSPALGGVRIPAISGGAVPSLAGTNALGRKSRGGSGPLVPALALLALGGVWYFVKRRSS